MLAIRLQRTGRKGYPTYRVIVQEAHRQPTSGRVVANLGSYNPHTKEITLDKEKAELYLKNGAQPSDRVVKLFDGEGVTLPAWVHKTSTDKQKSIKNAEKLRKNQPKEEPAPEAEVAESAEETAPAVDAPAEAPVEEAAESVEQVAEAEVADGQVTAEEEVAADAAPEAVDPSADAEDQAEKPAAE